MSKGTYTFTTPIYYVNAAPHLGTAIRPSLPTAWRVTSA